MASADRYTESGWSVLHYPELESTNVHACSSVKEQGKALHNTIILADQQTSGRGRSGRLWVSPKGNLYLSLIIKESLPLDIISQLSFVAALAVRDSVASCLEGVKADVLCKWPNDILVNGKKIAGILLESSPVFGTKEHMVIIGIGINLASYPKNVDRHSLQAMSLRELKGSAVSVKDFLPILLPTWRKYYQMWEHERAHVMKLWLEHAYGVGKEVIVRLPHETFSGVFDGMEFDSGALIVSLANGSTRRVIVGDVFF
jgi:BirA family biotin operon repressor/biotin-[acetyl-CoA-carboxylase] ligase